ncbi:MAG: hypothetical protein AAFO29_19900, partial [Actinomycetota bacterium]
MRSRSVWIAVAIALALSLLGFWPSGSSAQLAPRGSALPIVAIGVAQQTVQGPSVDIDLLPPTGLTLAETWERYDDTEGELRLSVLEKQSDDRALAGARNEVEELRDETREIAQSTVDNAITNYRQIDVGAGVFETDDLNAGLRANALGDAALVADTSTF